MQRTLRALLPALALLMGASSCSEDFDVLAPARPFTVVYGILDAGEPVNYVRIQKAYADPNKSALDLAKLPDSSYFPNITVSLYEVNGGNPSLLNANVPLVKMDTAGYVKNSGVFFTTPNYAYKITESLTPGRTYRLLIKHRDHVDTAETVIADVSGTRISELEASLNPSQKVELSPTNSADAQKDKTYAWRVLQYPQSTSIRYMNALLRFHFREQTIGGSAYTDKTVDYIFSRPLNNGGGWSPSSVISDKNNNFYVAIANGLGSAPAGMERLAGGVDLIAYFGTPELYNYQQNQATLGGLGGDQVQYRYTNLRGKSVIGVLASRAVLQRLDVPLSDGTVAELKTNPNTKQCNITGRITP